MLDTLEGERRANRESGDDATRARKVERGDASLPSRLLKLTYGFVVCPAFDAAARESCEAVNVISPLTRPRRNKGGMNAVATRTRP